MTGIISAMQMEIDPLLKFIDDINVLRFVDTKFYRGKLYGQDVVLTTSGEGKVSAAACAEAMMLLFDVDRIINIGVAGSLSDKLETGDVAIAKDVIQHDVNVTALGYLPGQVPGTDTWKVPCDSGMVSGLEQAADQMRCRYEVGTIASGDVFLQSEERKDWIHQTFDAIAVEMESAAIGQVCFRNKIPFASVRVISDAASDHAADDYRSYTDQATKTACDLVRLFLQNLHAI